MLSWTRLHCGNRPGELVSGHAKWAAAGDLIAKIAVSARFASQVVGLACSTLATSHPEQTPHDAGLRTLLCSYGKQHPRWGYHRAHYYALAEGWAVNHN